tara:strand:- start:1049 stop:1288 length:240 start_codon:yes stop_codon:yes gene_type:complete
MQTFKIRLQKGVIARVDSSTIEEAERKYKVAKSMGLALSTIKNTPDPDPAPDELGVEFVQLIVPIDGTASVIHRDEVNA